MSEAKDLRRISDEFRAAWEAGGEPKLAEYAAKVAEPDRVTLIKSLLAIDSQYRDRRQDQITRDLPQAGDEVTMDTTPAVVPVLKPPLPPQAKPAATRVKYFGEYEILREIARGGMGVVYKARQVKLNRIVAIKMVLSGEFAGQDAIQRFHSEAEAAANLDHPGIVPIYEIGEHNGQHYFSMGFIEGPSLQAKLVNGPLPAKDAANLCRKIAEAVAYAHSKQVIHRDLKPANVLIDRAGEPRVTDFGLAKRGENDSGLTRTGAVVGTPSYMPPEQAQGQIEQIGPTADIYSLGAMLYCMLTGRPPFQAASTLETLKLVTDSEPVSPRVLNPAVPKDLETICLKCLEKVASRRYQRTDELVAELDRFLAGRPILARPVGKLETTWRWCKRKPALAGTGLAAILSLVGGVSISTLYAIEAGRQRSAAIEARDQAIAAETVAKEQTAVAESNLQRAEAVKKSLVTALISINPDKMGRTLSLVDVLDQIQSRLSVAFENDPLTRAELLSRMGDSYQGLGAYNQMLTTRREAFVLLRDVKGRLDSETIEATVAYCWSTLAVGRPQDGVEILEEVDSALGREPTAIENDVITVKNSLGDLYRAAGQAERGIPILTSVLELATKSGASERDLASVYNNLALCHYELEQFPDAIRCFEQAVQQLESVFGKDHPTPLTTRSLLALAYGGAGRLEDAITLLRAILAKQLELLGAKHSDALQSADRLTQFLVLRSRELKAGADFKQAGERLRECLEVRQTYGFPPWLIFATKSSLGDAIVGYAKQVAGTNAEQSKKIFAVAETLLLEAEQGLRQHESSIPPSDQEYLRETIARIISLYQASGKPEQATKWQNILDTDSSRTRR